MNSHNSYIPALKSKRILYASLITNYAVIKNATPIKGTCIEQYNYANAEYAKIRYTTAAN